MPAASAAVGGTRRFVDISVPRNISASVNELEGAARVFNVDDLKEVWHSIPATAGWRRAMCQLGTCCSGLLGVDFLMRLQRVGANSDARAVLVCRTGTLLKS